ncbi:MAG: hypothetical protein DRP74_09320 [Candidatus Omnitrophota bacterium]|nr:MAG: hypothetical protein DRP74_09320 [Candidatus Omnitrophota bacterium]
MTQKPKPLKMPEKNELKKSIGELWCDWNMHKISGDEFAYQFGRIFEKELRPIWRKYSKLHNKIHEEMVKRGRML